MTIEARLAACATLMESRLDRLLRRDALSGVPARLADAMRYAVLGGGKRFRPFLVIETARLFAAPPEAAVQTAAAVEVLHCYSLVHDDLPAMDDDDMRRGRPTVHLEFDEATAILAGDALLTLAFELLADPSAHSDARVRAELVLGLARAAGAAGMVGGQQLDLEAETDGHAALHSLDGVRAIQERKTGALIRFCAEAGAILGGADDGQRRAIVAFGRALGLAFQIADDLLDATGDAAQMGKAAAKDAAAGKATFVSVLGLLGARQRLAEAEAEALAALSRFGAEADVLRQSIGFVTSRRS